MNGTEFLATVSNEQDPELRARPVEQTVHNLMD